MFLTLQPVWFDLADAVDQRFVQWYDTHADLVKDALLLGYSVIERGVRQHVVDESDCMWQTRYREEADRNREFQRKLEEEVQRRVDERLVTERKVARCEAEQEHAANIIEVTSRAKHWQSMYEMSQAHSDSRERHRKEVEALQSEIAGLKKQNFVRGNVGEQEVSECLRRVPGNFDVVDSTKAKRCCDLHLVDASGDFMAFECKNKQNVTRDDIEKFYDNVSYLKQTRGENVLGACFVSLRCNVPYRSEISYECRDGLPLLFVRMPDDARFFCRYVKLLWDIGVCSRKAGRHAPAADRLPALLHKLKPLSDRLVSMHRVAVKVRETCLRQATTLTLEIEEQTAGAIHDLAALLESLEH
jgi:hypothetical protein